MNYKSDGEGAGGGNGSPFQVVYRVRNSPVFSLCQTFSQNNTMFKYDP